MKAILILLTATLALGGCASGGSRSAASGSLLGSFAGSGSPAGGAGLAAIGSGLIGGAVGASLEPGDRRLALEAEYQALEYTMAGKPVSWTGTSNGSAGEVVAFQPYRVGSQDCRQYMHTVTMGARSRTMRGSACRNQDGSWTLLT